MSRCYDLKIVIPEDPSLWIYQSYLEKIDTQLNETLHQSLHVYEDLVDRTWSHEIIQLRMMIGYLEKSIVDNDDSINVDAVYETIDTLLSLIDQKFKAFEEDDLSKMREIAVKYSQLKDFVKVYCTDANRSDHLFNSKEIRLATVPGVYEVASQFEKHVTQAGNALLYLKEIVERLLSFTYLRTTLEMSNDKEKLVSEYSKSMNQLETHSLTATNALKAIRAHSLIGVIESSATYMYTDDASALLHDYRRYVDQKRSVFRKKVDPTLLSDYEHSLCELTSNSEIIQKLVEQLRYVMKFSRLNPDESYKYTKEILIGHTHSSPLFMRWLTLQDRFVPSIDSLMFTIDYSITKDRVLVAISCKPLVSSRASYYGSLNGIDIREHPEFIHQKNRIHQSQSDLDDSELDQLAIEKIIEEHGIVSQSELDSLPEFVFERIQSSNAS